MSEGDGSAAECVFCEIAQLHAPAREVMRTRQVLAFLPDVPAVFGHVLLIPIKHIKDIWSMDEETSSTLGKVTVQLAKAVTRATLAEGINIIQSSGEAAGQSVLHLHVHVVPRFADDRMPELWPHDHPWSSAELDAAAASVRAEI